MIRGNESKLTNDLSDERKRAQELEERLKGAEDVFTKKMKAAEAEALEMVRLQQQVKEEAQVKAELQVRLAAPFAPRLDLKLPGPGDGS